MTETVNTYWAKFGIDSSQFVGGIQQATQAFNTFYLGVTAAAGVAIMAFNEFNKVAADLAKTGDQLNDLSYNTGIAVRELQQLHYAAKMTMTEVSAVDAALTKLTLSMGQAANSSSTAGKAFSALGIDPKGKNVSDVLYELAEKTDKFATAQERYNALEGIFGRQTREILPFLSDLARDSEKFKQAMTIDQKTFDNATAYQQSWIDFWDKTDKLVKNVFFAPPTATKEAVEDNIKAWERVGWTQDDIKKTLIDLYGIEQLNKLGYYTDELEKQAAAEEKHFANKYANLTEEDFMMQKLYDDRAKYVQAMEDASTQEEFDAAAQAVRALDFEIQKAEESAKGLTSAASAIGPTFNSVFASQLAGNVGPDWGGYGDLANMTEEQLQEIINNSAGKSKNYVEKAQQYYNMIKSNPKAAEAAAATDDPKTKEVKTQMKKIADATQAGYVELEKLTLVHETAEAEMARVKYQSLLDYAAQAVNWCGSNPIIQKSAVLTKNGYDIDISPLATVTAPKLEAADFSGVRLTGGAVGGGGGGTTNNTTNNIYVTTKDNPNAVANGVSQKLANQQAQGGTV